MGGHHLNIPSVPRNLGPTRQTHAKVGHAFHLKWFFLLMFAYAAYDNWYTSNNHLRYVTVSEVEDRNLFPVPTQYNDYYAQRVCGYFYPEKCDRCKKYLQNNYGEFYGELLLRYHKGHYSKYNYTQREEATVRPNYKAIGAVFEKSEL